MFADLISLCTAAALPALPQNWWAVWSFAPAALLPLLVLLGHAAAPSRITGLDAGAARRWRTGGVALLAVALVSPLCRLAATLAWAHMAQLMVMVAACALLALGWRRTAGTPGTASRPQLAAAAFCHGALLWLWHVPVVYEAVLTHSALHVAAYALLIGSAFWFWREVLRAQQAHVGAALLAVLATMAHTGLLGALLTFAGTPLYALQAPGARAWGLDPLQDQQLAGLLMWVPGGLAYLLAALGLAFAVARGSHRSMRGIPSGAD